MRNWLLCIIAALLVVVFVEYQQVKYANDKWETAEANVKAYSSELSEASKKNTALKLSVDQLEYFQDSVLIELDNTRKELNIKDKYLQSLQHITSVFIKTDTLILRDTLFREPSFSLDTLLRDNWYSVAIGMKYPSTITVRPEFKSEKHVVVFTRKETVNPPKKFFLFRWFQKKHYVTRVEVIEKNPYVQGESSKYVEIVK